MNTTILFDLEKTLIEDLDGRGWKSAVLLTEQNPHLQSWIDRQKPFRAGLLSFAVWDDDDLAGFNAHLRPFLEERLGFVFDDELMLTKQNLLAKTRLWENMPFLDASDFDDFFRKRVSVENIWLHEFQKPDHTLILLDDTVPNLTTTSDVPGCVLKMIDPWSSSFSLM